MLSEIINDLKELRGANVKVFGQDTVLDEKPNDDDLIIDTIDVIENIYEIDELEEVTEFTHNVYLDGTDKEDIITLESGEEKEAIYSFYKVDDIDSIIERYDISIEEFFERAVDNGDMDTIEDEDGEEYYDIELAEEFEIEYEDACEYVEELNDMYSIKEIQSGNTFNGSSPLNHHINFTFYENMDFGDYYVLLRCHRYGDVRCNYTNYALLRAKDMEYIYCIFDYSKTITFEMEIDDEEVEVSCNIRANDNTLSIQIDSLNIDDETYVRDSIDEIKEYILEELI